MGERYTISVRLKLRSRRHSGKRFRLVGCARCTISLHVWGRGGGVLSLARSLRTCDGCGGQWATVGGVLAFVFSKANHIGVFPAVYAHAR